MCNRIAGEAAESRNRKISGSGYADVEGCRWRCVIGLELSFPCIVEHPGRLSYRYAEEVRESGKSLPITDY